MHRTGKVVMVNFKIFILLSLYLVCIQIKFSSAGLLIGGTMQKAAKAAVNAVSENQVVSTAVKGVETVLGGADDPDTNKNVMELIEDNHYPAENHVVLTPDGYILTIQRIPHGCNETADKVGKKEVVFLAHGLLAASDSFVIQGTNQSLGFILADAGYDVWMGNFRGNRYSTQHVKYSTEDDAFWSFSIDEMGYYDLPTMIDYVLKTVKRKKLFLIGQSLGSSIVFVSLSLIPEMNEKVSLYFAMAPVIHTWHMTHTGRVLCLMLNEFDKKFGPQAMLPESKILNDFKQFSCNTLLQSLTCDNSLAIFGTYPTYANKSRFGVFAAHFPTVTSTRVLAHYGQWILSKEFCMFDYGRKENLQRYGQVKPPLYDLTQVSAPVVLISSDSDSYGPPQDVTLIHEKLPNCVEAYRVPRDNFSHLDFALGTVANECVYQKIISVMKRVTKSRH